MMKHASVLVAGLLAASSCTKSSASEVSATATASLRTEPAPAAATASGPRLKALDNVDLAGSFAVVVGSGAQQREGTVKLAKSGSRYVGTAVIGGKSYVALAHRDGNSLVGVFKPRHDGSWIGHYKVFCDKMLEGTVAESESSVLGRELLSATSESLADKTTIRYGQNFQAYFTGSLQLAPLGDALVGTYSRTDGYAGKAVAVRLGDTVAIGYEFSVGSIYTFNLQINDSSATALVGHAASRLLLDKAGIAAMTWTRPARPEVPVTQPSGGATATFANGTACIPVEPGGHALEKLIRPASSGGGGKARGEDCSRLSGNYAKCGYSTCQVNLDWDINNCGRCKNSCDFGETCDRGSCVPH